MSSGSSPANRAEMWWRSVDDPQLPDAISLLHALQGNDPPEVIFDFLTATPAALRRIIDVYGTSMQRQDLQLLEEVRLGISIIATTRIPGFGNKVSLQIRQPKGRPVIDRAKRREAMALAREVLAAQAAGEKLEAAIASTTLADIRERCVATSYGSAGMLAAEAG